MQDRVDKVWRTVKKNILVILFFAMFLCYGLYCFKDYGISTDELIERDSALINYKRIFPSVTEIKTDSVDFAQLKDLSEWKDRYYGVALQLVPVMIEHMFDFQLSLRQVYLVKHCYTFLLFFVSCIFFYKIAYMLSRNRYMALLATAMLVLSPRIFSDSFYNMKDMFFLPVFVVNLYFAIKFLQKSSIKTMIPLAIISALCTNTRIVGGILIFFCLLFSFIKSIMEKRWRKQFFYCLGTGVLCLGCYILVTPITWTNTVQEILNLAGTFSNYTKWSFDVFYLGSHVPSTDLPWHYLFVWIGISTPVLYLILTVLGLADQAVAGLRAMVRKNMDTDEMWVRLLLFMMLIVPIAYVLIKRPVLYTGWRHFFFIYPVMILFAMFAVMRICALLKRWKVLQWSAVGAIGIYMLFVGKWMLHSHPYEFMYFNRIGRNLAAENFDRDYWDLAGLEILQYLADLDQRDEIKVYMTMNYCAPMLPEEDYKRIKEVYTVEEAEYVLEPYRDMAESDAYFQWVLYNEIYRVEVDGIKLQSIFQRGQQWLQSTMVREERDGISYSLDGITWIDESTNDQTVLTGELPEAREIDKVTARTTAAGLPENFVVFVGNEEGVFERLDQIAGYTTVADGISAVFDMRSVKYIRILYDKDTAMLDENWNIDLYVPLGYELNPLESGIQEVNSDNNPKELPNVKDGDSNTYWTTGVEQSEGICFDITLKDEQKINGITLEMGKNETDYPRNLEIYTSLDGEDWRPVSYTLQGETYLFEPIDSRYIRLRLGETEAGIGWNWGIGELTVFIQAY